MAQGEVGLVASLLAIAELDRLSGERLQHGDGVGMIVVAGRCNRMTKREPRHVQWPKPQRLERDHHGLLPFRRLEDHSVGQG